MPHLPSQVVLTGSPAQSPLSSSVLISGLQVSSNVLGLTGTGVCRVQPGGPAQEMTQQMRLLLGLQQDILWPGTPGVAGLPHVPNCFHIRLALGASISFQGCSAQPGPLGGEQENKGRAPPQPRPARALLAQTYNSHATDGPLGNRQSSGSYGSFQTPFL